MPIIDGEKWACQSCIKGHRVSGCTHTDRDLHHINPKGRPVKQCEHCRGARKSKSHHAKCDCGDKKDKHHKEKGDAKGDASGCHCHSSGKCICGLKKDGLGLKLDTTKQTLHDARAKPKLTSTHSDNTLTVFANGHHKPCHRNNMSAHNAGLPYKIPRPHTLHGPAAFASYSHENLDKAYASTPDPVQRSMDTLSLSNNDFHNLFGSAQRPMDHSLPLTPVTGSFDGPNLGEAFFAPQNSAMFNQDANSPSESALSDTVPQWPWANTVTSMPQFGAGSLSTSPSQDCLPNLAENDWAIPSAGLNNPLWSAGDLPLNPGKLENNLTQPISHSGDSNRQSAPGLSTSSSAQSEVGDGTFFGELPSAVSDANFWEDSPAYRIGTSEAMRQGPTSVPTSGPAVTNAGDGMDKGALMFGTEIGFNPNGMMFANTAIDEAQSAKESNADLKSVMMGSIVGTSANDGSTAYSTADFSEPRGMNMPNNIDDVLSSSNPWVPMVEQGGLGLDNSVNTAGLPLSNYNPGWFTQ